LDNNAVFSAQSRSGSFRQSAIADLEVSGAVAFFAFDALSGEFGHVNWDWFDFFDWKDEGDTTYMA